MAHSTKNPVKARSGKESIDYVSSVNDRKDATPNVRAEARSIDNELHALHDRYRPGAVTHVDDLAPEGVAPSQRFPVKLTQRDPHDEMLALKASLIDGRSGGATPFGMATLQPEDLQWIQRKRQAQTYLALQGFIDNCGFPSRSVS